MPTHFIARNEDFHCDYCHRFVEKIKYGGGYRNHCPFCLHSKHVDEETPGDRKSKCKGLMMPVAVFNRKTGEYVLIHRCGICGEIRYNRIAGDDDFEKILQLPQKEVRKMGMFGDFGNKKQKKLSKDKLAKKAQKNTGTWLPPKVEIIGKSK